MSVSFNTKVVFANLISIIALLLASVHIYTAEAHLYDLKNPLNVMCEVLIAFIIVLSLSCTCVVMNKSGDSENKIPCGLDMLTCLNMFGCFFLAIPYVIGGLADLGNLIVG